MKKKKSYWDVGFAKKYWCAVALMATCVCHAGEFANGMSKVLGVFMGITFLSCCFFIGEGVYQYRQGGNYGKDIVGLLISAGAVAIVGVLFVAFGMSSAKVSADFSAL